MGAGAGGDRRSQNLMVTIRSDIPEKGDEWLQGLQKQVEDIVYRALVKAALLGEQQVKGIIEKEAYDTGRLLRSVTSTILKSPYLMRLVLGTNLDYAIFVEQGRKPGKWPNLDALVSWCGRHMRRQ